MSKNRRNNSKIKSLDEVKSRKMAKSPRRIVEFKKDILVATARASRRNGFKIASMDQIAAEIGGTKGTIYYYYETKAEMLYSMQMYIFSLIRGPILQILADKSLSPRQRLKNAIREQLVILSKHWELMRVLWTDAALMEQPKEMASAILRVRTRYLNEFGKVIDEMVEAEGINNVNRKLAVKLMFGMLDSIFRWYKYNKNHPASEIADYAVKCIFEGLF